VEKGLSKAGQATVFVIIALILIIVIGSLAYIISKSNGLNNLPGASISASKAADNIKFERDSCIKKLAIEGLDLYGLNENSVTGYISNGLLDCVSSAIQQYSRQMTIEYDLKSVDVEVNENEIKIEVDFPIKITKGEAVENIGTYSLTFQRKISRTIEHNEDCVLERDAGLISFDGKFEIYIPEGIKATNEDGSCLESITLRLEDAVLDYGKRAASLTPIAYVPGPFGAKFSNSVNLKLKYTQEEYMGYLNAVINEGSYPTLERNLRIQFFDKTNSNFYVYPSLSPLKNEVDILRKQIEAKVDQFYGGKLSLGNDCISDRESMVESYDRRVWLVIFPGTSATKSDGTCIDKIEIQIAPKSSPVVNFGNADYNLLPDGAVFSPHINYIYRYTTADTQNPVFLYGYSNWQNLINGTWVSPLNDSRPSIELISPDNNARNNLRDVEFKFRAVDDYSAEMNCSVFVNGILKASATARNNEQTVITARLDEGLYSWFIRCSDKYGTSNSGSRNLAVGTNTPGLTGFIIKNFFSNVRERITGKVTEESAEENRTINIPLVPRNPSSLRIAYYDEESRIYRPWPTRVDNVNHRIIAQIGHFSMWIPISYLTISAQGCEDRSYISFTGVARVASDTSTSPPSCTAGKTSESGQTITINIAAGNSCGDDSSLKVTELISSGDSGTLLVDGAPGRDISPTAGDHTFQINPITDANGELARDLTGNSLDSCAYANAYLKEKGIGSTVSTSGASKEEIITAEGYCSMLPEDMICSEEEGSGEDGENGEGSGESDSDVEASLAINGEASSGVMGGGSWASLGKQIYGSESSAFEAIFDHEESETFMKGYGLLNTSVGVFASICNHNTRDNCWLLLNWQEIYAGDQESIGQGYDMGNGMIIFPAEGQGVVYDNGQAQGTVQLRHSAAAIDYHGTPAFISSEENGEYIINAITGEILKRLAVNERVGIPWDAAKIPGTEEWFIPLVDNEGEESFVTTTDVVISMQEATAAATWKDKLLASAKGIIYEVDVNSGTVSEYLDTGSEKVNHMWYDSPNDILWVSCSSYDKLFYIDNQSNIYNVIELTDDPSSGGSLFDTRVTAGWWLRAKGQQGQWYRIERRQTAPANTVSPVANTTTALNQALNSSA